jgi:hypothetical protein
VACAGTPVLFTGTCLPFTLIGEQFWGRAAPGVRRLARVGTPVKFSFQVFMLHGGMFYRWYFPIHSA